jgi:hypothetical protein
MELKQKNSWFINKIELYQTQALKMLMKHENLSVYQN